MQPQGHVQMIVNTIDYDLNPQASLEAPRWQWLEGKQIELELQTPTHIAEGLQELRDVTADAKWMILSGGDQQEIRNLFAKRDLAKHFDGGLFGSPDNKDAVLAREKANGHLQMPALFIGDSKYDHEASTNAGLDFIFVSDWTEVPDWQEFCQNNSITVFGNLKAILR